MTDKESARIDRLIHSPTDAVTATTEHLRTSREAIRAGLGLHFPLPEIADRYPIPPLLPGNLFMVLAVTSNGKSMFKEFWMADAARRIQEHGTSDHILISISAEDLVEEQMADQMRRMAAKRGKIASLISDDGLLVLAGEIGSVPVYYIGASIARSHLDVPDPNMTNISKAVYRIIERRKDANQDTQIMGTFLDYVQALPLDPELMRTSPDKRRRLQVRQDFFEFRMLCLKTASPGVPLVQAKIDLGGAPSKDMKTPGLTDTQEASAIAQHTDRGISLWMPKTTHTVGTRLEHNGVAFEVVQSLMWMRCVKQRGTDPITLKRLPAGAHWALEWDYDTGDCHTIDPGDTIGRQLESRAARREKKGEDPNGVW